ncbi:MAG: lysylphosphatidylglycerol synthase transmembrane domain-containing protein [Bacteroidota bacterium]
MNKKISSFIQYLVLLLLGGGLIYLSIKRTDVSKEEVVNAFTESNWLWIMFSLIISFFSHYARAYRWNYLLENYGHHSKINISLSSVLIGYLANYGLPRMGEISRCAVVNKYQKIPMDIALGTVIAERVVDMLLLIVIFILVVIFNYSDLYALLNQYIFTPFTQKLEGVNWIYLFIFLIIGMCFIYWLFKRKTSNNQPSLMDKILSFIQNIIRPLMEIHKIKRPLGFWIWSLIIWLMYYLSMYTCALAMPSTEQLGILKILVLFLFGTVGVIVTPGGIGAYHFLLTEILLYYQLDNASAVAFPWIIWGTQFILILISGGLSFILLPVFAKNLNND